MSVSENEAAALWLAENIFKLMDVQFIIAGKEISKSLHGKLMGFKNIRLVSDPSDELMNELVQNAQLNILPSMNTTGVKLKLLHALFHGRFCIINANALKGSGIHTGVHIAETPSEYIKLINQLFDKEFSAEDKKNRQEILSVYNNIANAEKFNELL